MADFEQVKKYVTNMLTGGNESDVEFEDENYCALTDKSGNVLHLSYNPVSDKLTLMGTLGKLPEVEEAINEHNSGKIDEHASVTILKYFLECNLLWERSAGATFALVEDGDYLVVQKSFDLDTMSQDDFNTAIKGFSADLNMWIDNYGKVQEKAIRGDSLDEIAEEL
jgi:hypothetical protein